ncbi:MAG: hypothetical protein AVDCRST_MAG72-2342, partial [uncultured Nocardioidaceae bacterium]
AVPVVRVVGCAATCAPAMVRAPGGRCPGRVGPRGPVARRGVRRLL